MSVPDIAIINFSSIPDGEVQNVLRAINRQVTEDFMPIWGSGHICKLHASAFDPAHPDILKEDPVPAEGVIYLVNDPHIAGALGYHDMNNAEIPVGFVFTALGDWTVTLSHEVLELIIDPTVNIFVPGPDPRDPDNAAAWLFHTYEVCDAVERTTYEIDHVPVSNFVTPQYFRQGDAAGTRNDFLGVGVDSFGVTDGSHLGTIDPSDSSWVTILGRNVRNRSYNQRRAEQFTREKPRDNPSDEYRKELQTTLAEHREKPPKGCTGLCHLHAITRTMRYQAAAERMKK